MRRRLAAFVLLFACASAQAGPIGLSALGDSLTDTYSGKPYAGPNRSWTANPSFISSTRSPPRITCIC